MTPEQECPLRAVLNDIGFENVLRLDPYRAGFAWQTFSPTGRNIFESYASASAGVDKIETLLSAARLLEKELGKLSTHEKRVLERSAGNFWPPDLDDWFPTISREEKSLRHIIPGLCGLQDFARLEKESQATGRARKVAVRQIAIALAEVYVIGTGAKVTHGVDPVSNEPNTKFLKALKGVFLAVGVSHKSVKRTAQEVWSEFSDADVKELKQIHTGDVKAAPPYRTPMFRGT